MPIPASRTLEVNPAESFDGQGITGATVDENAVQVTIVVDPAAKRSVNSPKRARTFREGMTLALASLAKGIGTKVELRPGIYRESVADLRFSEGAAKNAVLVIEGTPGKTILSGADIWPLRDWKRDGDHWTHPWPFTWGDYSPYWGPPKQIAHRGEMAFINGDALRQEILEKYKVVGRDENNLFSGTDLKYEYLSLNDPKTTLMPGTFGVTERAENGKQIVVYPEEGEKLSPDSIEVSTRKVLLNLSGKNNVVLRGLIFERCANDLREMATLNPVQIGAGAEDHANNVLVDNCRFLWNSGIGLAIYGDDWTLRNSIFNYNGMSGVVVGGGKNLLYQDCEMSFNVWRIWRGGENGWSHAGTKIHEENGHKVIRNLAIGNLSMGLWWDIHCHNVFIADSVSLANSGNGFMWELSQGPFHGRRLVAAGGGRGNFNQPMLMLNIGNGLVEDSVFYHNHKPTDDKDRNSVVAFASHVRTDVHAQREPIVKGIYEIRDSLIVGGPDQKWLMLTENWDAPQDTMMPLGRGNVFFSPQGKEAGLFRARLTKQDQYPNRTFAEFIKMSHQINPHWFDPRLRDPENYDFRLASDSPLWADRGSYPQYVLPKARLSELHAFWKWLRVDPQRGPGPMSPDEP